MFDFKKIMQRDHMFIFYLLFARVWSVDAAAQHFVSDMMTGGFFLFIIVMIGFHCYLKRQERKKFEALFKTRSIFDLETLNGNNIGLMNQMKSPESADETCYVE